MTASNRRALIWFVIGVATFAVASLVIQAHVVDLPFTGTASVASLVLFAFLTHLLASRMPKGGLASVAFVPLCAVLMLMPSWSASVVLAASVILGTTRHQPQLIRFVFNISQAATSLALAGIVYSLLGGSSILFFDASAGIEAVLLTNAIPATALLATFLTVNSVLVSIALGLSSGEKAISIWRANTLLTVVHLAIAVPTAFIIAWIAARYGPVWVASLSLPLLGMRQLYKQSYDLQQVNQDLLELTIKAIEARDPYTSGHSRRVSEMAETISRAMGLNQKLVEEVRLAGLLHDVGKIHEAFAPILRKPGKLTESEWEIMKTHPALGAELVQTVSHLRKLVPSVRGHHENWDGTGYPDGLAGEKIPLGARIITVADTIDALTTDRPYRAALGPAEVRAEFVRCRGAQFDPAICDVILSADVWGRLFPDAVASAKDTTVRLGRRVRPAPSAQAS
ncbi:MAG: HD-GYP domain-containing protein [Gemmatimonadota bacterium]|jgi:putative nucleotidyltransferase with HDIG domain